MALHKQETLPHLHHTTRTDWGVYSIPSMSTYMLLFLNHLFLLLLSTKCDGYSRSKDACLPFNCGEFTNVQFPFHEFSSPECGLPEFELLCTEKNGVRLLIANRIFEVKSISLSERLVLVADSQLIDAVAKNRYCNLPAPFNESELGYFHQSQYSGYVEFMSCCSRFPGESAALATCGGTYLLHRYIISDSMNLSEYCWSIGKFPIQKKSVKEPGNQLEEILRDGFYLTWPWSSECMTCKQNGGRCGHNPDDGKFSCLYSSHVPSDKVLNIIGVCLITILVLAAISAYMKKRSCKTNAEGTPNVEDFLKDYKAQMPTRYSYADIRKMTNCFSQKLGQGGYGGVYKGALTNGYHVAVKVLDKSSDCKDTFINEVATLGMIHHVNVVRLLGFCSQGRKRALVYEFMLNGSLDKVISAMGNGVHVLSWEQIYHIALGIARGIWYLHRGCNVRIMHFDIKPHNILLDDNFNPKISDFGLAKLCPMSNITSMVMRGTLGYIAPELFSRTFGVVSCKTDIYSYGVLILETVGKMKLGDMEGENPSPMCIPVWMYDQLSQGRILETGEIIEDDEKILKKMAIVGFWCIQLNPVHRPCIDMVIQMLEGDVETLQMPPRPFPSPEERECMLFCSEITKKNELPNNQNSTDN